MFLLGLLVYLFFRIFPSHGQFFILIVQFNFDLCFIVHKRAQCGKMRFFFKDFFSKSDQIHSFYSFVTFTEEIFNGKLHFLCCDLVLKKLRKLMDLLRVTGKNVCVINILQNSRCFLLSLHEKNVLWKKADSKATKYFVSYQ